jgi:hypothetical protein
MLVQDRPTRRFVRAFAESVKAWLRHTTEGGTIDCDAEELIVIGNKSFEAIVDLDARRHAAMFEKGAAPDAEVAREIESLYHAWADTAVLLVKCLPGRQSETLDALIENLDLAMSPIDDESRIMSDELIALRDAAIGDHRAGEGESGGGDIKTSDWAA